ncbi:glycoside hydrolase family 16 protein [Streptomyces sp. NPDC006967]|uniref:glycoside hydrolase family 16 protein n=1 Tax=Streptomyces sp. NPDC006967 TaxID=3156906 RepID=UPI0033D9028B
MNQKHAAAPSAGTVPPSSWRVLWQDTFDGPAGSPPDPALWQVVTGQPFGAGIEFHTDDPANVGLDGAGHLRITATHEEGEYRAAWLETLREDFVPRPGGALRLDARVKTAAGPGLDCALWAWGTQLRHRGDEDPVQAWYRAGEIDVLEALGSEPDSVWGAVHSPECHQIPSLGMGARTTTEDGSALSEDFHTYSAVWRRGPDSITWYLDGREYLRLTPQDTTPKGWLFDQPVYFCLAIIIGSPGGPVLPGDPDPSTLPSSLLVDSITVSEEIPA